MATASRTMSPGGALLRASRMFSLPPPIPPPPGDYAAATSYNSETATQAYPTLQVITTPEHLRQRGDWGFKRALPMRSTMRTSTPLIKVRQVDSIENVTDFKSASDHALSLVKFQEMNMPIELPHEKPTLAAMHVGSKSVFEEEHDFTDLTAFRSAKTADDQPESHRWKYEGPWLANMTEGVFQKYLKKQVRTKRTEFRRYLRERLAEEMTRKALQTGMDQGEDELPPAVTADDITDEQLTEYLRELRENRQTLFRFVSDFLDLAPIAPKGVMDIIGNFRPNESAVLGRVNPYAVEGPPITHPSAGISYLRTTSYLDNHPVYGPQKTHAPVYARILAARNQDRLSYSAKLGVGGVVTDTPKGAVAFNEKNPSIKGLSEFDPHAEGGSKAWVQPLWARVSSSGRVTMTVDQADVEATLVQREREGEVKVLGKIPESKPEGLSMRDPSSSRIIRKGDKQIYSSPRGYGVGSWSSPKLSE